MDHAIKRSDMSPEAAGYTTQIALVVPVSWKQRLSELAQARTIAESQRVTVSDLIREALDEAFILSHDNHSRGYTNEGE